MIIAVEDKKNRHIGSVIEDRIGNLILKKADDKAQRITGLALTNKIFFEKYELPCNAGYSDNSFFFVEEGTDKDYRYFFCLTINVQLRYINLQIASLFPFKSPEDVLTYSLRNFLIQDKAIDNFFGIV